MVNTYGPPPSSPDARIDRLISDMSILTNEIKRLTLENATKDTRLIRLERRVNELQEQLEDRGEKSELRELLEGRI